MSETKIRDRLLSIREVEARVGLKQPTIYAWMKDGRFPRPRVLGPRTVRWTESEIETWVAALPTT